MKQEQIDELQALLDVWYSPIRRDGISFYDTDGDVLATFDFESEAKMFMDLYDAAPALLEAARENLRLREALEKALSALKCHTGDSTIYTQRACEEALGKETV